jgi:hypothetical protein
MTVDKTIKDWIEIDTTSNYTPDLPALRYFGGAIPVFLWDDNQDYGILRNALGPVRIASAVEVRHPQAVTVNKYIPWYNMIPTDQYYPSYCLEESVDLDFILCEEYNVSTPRQMKGKIAHITLAALQELDAYYENEYNFDRTKIKAYPSLWNKTPVECFTWFNTVDQVCEFDSNTSEYVFREGIDPVPYKEHEGLYVYA